MLEQTSGHRVGKILLVDDSDDETVLMKAAFKMSQLPLTLHHVKDGIECMMFLRRSGSWTDVETPDLILLDSNMPRMNGRQVLMALREDEKLCHIPVVVLSTSSDPEEIVQMYRLGCRSYIIKPVDFSRFREIVDSLVAYWFIVTALPTIP